MRQNHFLTVSQWYGNLSNEFELSQSHVHACMCIVHCILILLQCAKLNEQQTYRTLCAVIESLRNGYDFDNLNAHSSWSNYDFNENNDNNEKLNEEKEREN